MSKKELFVSCPICKVPVPRSEDNFPFCSERCKTADLGNWASDAYAIKGESTNEFDEFNHLDDENSSIH